MKDHRFIKDDGPPLPVAEMPIDDIHKILGGDISVEIVPSPDDPPGVTIEHLMERLRIELLIRRLGL